MQFLNSLFFQSLSVEDAAYREVYDRVLEIATEITNLKNTFNVTKIAWLFDSALSSRHLAKENTNTEKLENGHNIFHFTITLLQILVLMINSQKNYLIQYNEKSAW
jgi:hypothetical protein